MTCVGMKLAEEGQSGERESTQMRAQMSKLSYRRLMWNACAQCLMGVALTVFSFSFANKMLVEIFFRVILAKLKLYNV